MAGISSSLSWRAKQVARWTVPPAISGRVGRVARAVRDWRVSKQPDLSRNRDVRDRHRGERAFVVATGPSIKQQNLTALRGELVFGVSNFFVHPDYDAIKPAYHCIAPYHHELAPHAWDAWMDEVAEKTGNATLVFGQNDKARNTAGDRFAERDIRWLELRGRTPLEELKQIDLSRPLPSPQSVPVMALYSAIGMGCREIVLLGCDHDWILHMGESRHFYAEREHAMNRKGHNEWYEPGYGDQWRCYHRLWTQYEAIHAIAARQGVTIRNATAGGLLDVFERIRLEDVVGQPVQRRAA